MASRSPRAVLAFLIAGLALLGAAGSLRAGDEPPPPDPGGQPADKGVRLVYKFSPGQVQRFRVTAKQEVTFTSLKSPAALPTIPISADLVYSEKVASAQKNSAVIGVTVASVVSTTEVSQGPSQGTIVVKAAGGKVSVTQNGKPFDGVDAKTIAALKAMTSGRAQMYRRTVRGLGTPLSSKPEQSNLDFGSVFYPGVPTKAVKPGDTWESNRKVSAEGTAAPGGTKTPRIPMKFTYTLESVQVKNGKQFAIIDVMGGPPDTAPDTSATMSCTGTGRFDVKRGVFVSGQYQLDATATLPSSAIPGLRGVPGSPNQQVELSTSAQVVITESTPGGSGKPPAKKH